MEKYKRADIVGIERENERNENYKSTRNPQIDKSKTRLNYHTVPHEKKYLPFIDDRIKQLSPKRKIKDDAVLVTSFILGSNKEFFDRITAEQQKQFFADCTDFFSERYGKENVISAVVHLDESTPHLHFNLRSSCYGEAGVFSTDTSSLQGRTAPNAKRFGIVSYTFLKKGVHGGDESRRI